MDSVAIIMSTYNGEKYLAEQIDSILAQKDVDIALYIRDDGSSDGTLSILDAYRKKNANITVVTGSNVGVGSSFMAALKSAGTHADYYAFADQDDIWLPEKIRKAINCIKAEEDVRPVCYCSNQILVDCRDEIIGIRHEKPVDTGYLQVLCNNMVTGCTMVWNRKLQKILADDRYTPSPGLLKKRIHDVWVAMVAAVVGTIYYDPNAYIHYRQHENNVVGIRRGSILKLWQRKISNPELRRGRSDLAKEIKERFGQKNLDEAIYNVMNRCANYRNSIKDKTTLMKDDEIRCHSSEGKVSYTIKVLLDLF